MTAFTGQYTVQVTRTGAIPLPPAWWLAALAADPSGRPGPNLLVMELGDARFRIVTPDRHRKLAMTAQAMDRTDPLRARLERTIFELCFPAALTPDGALPGSAVFDAVTGLAPGRAVRLSGEGPGFELSPQR